MTWTRGSWRWPRNAVNSAYEGVAHWMWDHPEMDVEQLADWTVELLLPGLRRFT